MVAPAPKEWPSIFRRLNPLSDSLLLDHDGYLPSFAVVTEGKTSEI